MGSLVNLLNEVGMLAKTPRSGFAFLGSGQQSVSEHSYRMAIVALVLASLVQAPIDKHKLLLLCLFHDLPEARSSDLNYVNKKYVQVDEAKVLKDIEGSSPLGPDIVAYIQEFEAAHTPEAQLAKDADQLELMLVLKAELDTGNPRAHDWFENAFKRLKTPEAKQLAREIRTTPFDAWWLQNKDDPHWVHGSKEKL
jgi:putative hydrolases of HD superfamily